MADCPTPGKARHATRSAARLELRRIGHARARHRGLRPYPCPCGQWHIGQRDRIAQLLAAAR